MKYYRKKEKEEIKKTLEFVLSSLSIARPFMCNLIHVYENHKTRMSKAMEYLLSQQPNNRMNKNLYHKGIGDTLHGSWFEEINTDTILWKKKFLKHIINKLC